MATNANDLPARGEAKVIENNTGVQQVSEVATDGAVQSGSAASQNFMGALPGTVNEDSRRKSLVLAGLGDVHADDNNSKSALIGQDEPGEGDRVVVLSDYVSGPNGSGFVRGNVRFLSLFFAGWGDKELLPVVRKNAARLFELGAIRLATDDEAKLSQVDVTPSSETSDVQKERDARIRAERELEAMRLQLAAAQNAQSVASPIPAPKDGQQAAGNGGGGTGADGDGMPNF